MKKYSLLILVMLLALACPLTVVADVVFGNDFQHENRGKIIKPERTRFVINSPDGYVIIKDEPGSKKDMIKYMKEQWPGRADDEEYIKSAITFKNGQEFFIYGVYIHNGEYWGIMPTGHNVSYPGWVRMYDLLVIYTREDFEKDNKNKIHTYSGKNDDSLKNKKLVIWEWPGSDRAKCILDDKDIKIDDISIKSSYKDKDGREWGYVEIYYDNDWFWLHRNFPWNGWVCLSDSENSNIPSFYPAPSPQPWEFGKDYIWSSDSVTENHGPDVPGNYSPNTSDDENVFSTLVPWIVIVLLSAGAVVYIKALKKKPTRD